MKGGAIIILAALATYAVVAGCAMFTSGSGDAQPARSTVVQGGPAVDADPPSTTPPPKLDGLPFRGMVLQVQRIDDPEIYYKAIDDIAGLGADTVEIVVDSKQENGKSDVIFVDVRQTPSPDKLTALIAYAKSKNLRVVLMPIVLLEAPISGEWRGTIKPDSWEEWFESYRQMEMHYAAVAEAAHVDVYIVGSELVSTESKRDEWVHTIRDVRAQYHGLITYSANWDHYRNIPFWDHLDLIATNSYYKLGEDKNVSVAEIVSRWRAIQEDLIPWIRSQHKPYMFTEVGWCSMANAAHEPWDYTKDEISVPLDLNLQKKLYEGFFQAWNGIPELGGLMIWQWTPNSGGRSDRGYTPRGKPAEDVLREWFAKPRWKVQ